MMKRIMNWIGGIVGGAVGMIFLAIAAGMWAEDDGGWSALSLAVALPLLAGAWVCVTDALHGDSDVHPG
jgi:hypothetical protein